MVFLLAVVGIGALAGLFLGFDSWGFIAVELAAIAAMLIYDRRYFPVIDRWDRGATGEEQVGALLEELRGTGWHVLHDVSFGRGNIDHVLVGPAGVLTVETKSWPGRINVDQLDEKPLKQAYAQAKAVSEAMQIKASPLLVFSRAFLYPKAVSQRRGVVVLPSRMIAGHLERRAQVLDPEQAADIHARLAQSCSGTND